jgi:mono/diheme cytochrome c family protein
MRTEKLNPLDLSCQRKGGGTMLRRSLWLYAQLALVVLFSQFVIVAAEEAVQPKKLNPFTGNPEAITEGRALYLRVGCSGCHGVGGGGGMGPALLDDEWTFGSDDEILFKLIKGAHQGGDPAADDAVGLRAGITG